MFCYVIVFKSFSLYTFTLNHQWISTRLFNTRLSLYFSVFSYNIYRIYPLNNKVHLCLTTLFIRVPFLLFLWSLFTQYVKQFSFREFHACSVEYYRLNTYTSFYGLLRRYYYYYSIIIDLILSVYIFCIVCTRVSPDVNDN